MIINPGGGRYNVTSLQFANGLTFTNDHTAEVLVIHRGSNVVIRVMPLTTWYVVHKAYVIGGGYFRDHAPQIGPR